MVNFVLHKSICLSTLSSGAVIGIIANIWRKFMDVELLNCWEIKKCERQKGGMKVYELSECIASKSDMGHSCWVCVHPAKYIISIIAQMGN
jgi:hypothetical protein